MIKQYEELLQSVKREGMDKLIEFIRKSDFYTAPASTRYHLSCEGGLLKHSLNVYEMLKEKLQQPVWKQFNYDVDTTIIVSLLHDLCKTYFYTVEYRNAKNDAGQWEKVPYFAIDDKIPYGHGEKSVVMIEEFIKLKPVERYAIRWHMGFSVSKDDYNALGVAITKYPLALALSESDLEATYILEKEEK